MTLAEATAGFLDYIRPNTSTVTPQAHTRPHKQATQLLTAYFSADSPLSDVTATSLRDFLGRWYTERTCASKLSSPEAVPDSTTDLSFVSSSLPESDQLPTPQELLVSIADFINWADKITGDEMTSRCSPMFMELSETLPRAVEINRVLTRWLQERGGAFTFPEFLTSFEEGGQSQYDIDTPGDVGALEGYFRIIRVEGSGVEAEDLISEESIWPIIFPLEVAVLLDRAYVINLELVRTKEGWRIASCGFAYPPGTEV
jgi:hypothetical protein